MTCHGDGGNDTHVMGTEAMTHLSRIQLTSGMKSVHGGLAACSERTRQGTLSDGVCTRRTGGVQSVHDRDPFGTESVHGQKHPPIVHNFRHGRLPTMYAFRPFLYTVGTRWGREVRTAGAFFAAFTPRPSTFLTVRAPWHPRARRRASCTLSVPNGCPPLRGLSFRKAGVEVRVERLADGGPDAGAHAVRARYHGVGSWEGGAAWAYTRTPGKAPSRRPCTPPGSSQRAETDSHLVHGKGG